MDKPKVKILPKRSPTVLPSLQISSPPLNNKGRIDHKRSSLSNDLLGGFSGNSSFARRQKNMNLGQGPDKLPISIPKFEKVTKSYDTSKPTGHRPVTSCSFCRQHKIKCNALDNFPNPCTRCEKMLLKCEIDPQFRPKKGSQLQSLKTDVDELKAKIEILTKNETLLTQALAQQNSMSLELSSTNIGDICYTPSDDLNSIYSHSSEMEPFKITTPLSKYDMPDNSPVKEADFPVIEEFVLGEVRLSLEKANKLHDCFINRYLAFLPILKSNNATELYYKSKLLFWTVILTASLSEPEPSLYMTLSSLIKQMAIETCWIRTPRSTHVIQALLILCIWPLPNEKVLDDTSYRFVGLAKNLSLQLGLHRGGGFIKEFSRTQVNLGPDSEKWRTRSWLTIFFLEQFWSSTLGLPPSINTTDYLLENARIDQSLPKDFRQLISLSIFQSKLVNVMGISVTRPDGLLEPSNRAGSLNILDRELERLKFKLKIEENSAVEIYFLYVKLMICGFAFLPGTPIEDQVKYVSSGYLASTRIVTIISQMINNNKIALIELPIYIRQALTYSVLVLFKLNLSRYMIEKYVDSARQSIVTVHRLLRNTLSSWKDLQNDISRTAKILENLNIVLYTYPEVFIVDDDSSIISKIRSHLTASLFYDLVWCVHEARRRTLLDKQNPEGARKVNEKKREEISKLAPLPFYNQITKDDFKTITTTSPNGTTITTLVPTDQAMLAAKINASDNKPLEINGIPILMLEATGSFKDGQVPEQSQRMAAKINPASYDKANVNNTSVQFSNQVDYQSQLPKVDLNSSQVTFDIPNDQMLMNANIILNNQLSNAPTPLINDQMDNFFQQQSNGWLNNDNYQDDDFLGWFDINSLNS